jgi:hypothetical protein
MNGTAMEATATTTHIRSNPRRMSGTFYCIEQILSMHNLPQPPAQS